MSYINAPAGFAASGVTGALPGAQNNMLANVGGGIAGQTAVQTLYDYNPLATLRQVVERHGASPHIFRWLLKTFGMNRAVDAPITAHYESDFRQPTIKINAIITASTGLGANVVLELHSDSMYTTGLTVGGSATAANASAVRENEIIEFGGGKKGIVVSKNTNTNPHRITVRPLQDDYELLVTANIVAGTSYAIQTNAWQEGSGLPVGRIRRIFKYANEFQITKEGFGATGTAATGNLFVRFDQVEEPGGVQTIHGVMKKDAVENFERLASNALLFGEEITNVSGLSTTLGYDVPTKGTEGLWSFVTSWGHIPTYAIGGYVMADFDKLGKILNYERISAESVMCMMGYDAFTQVENLLFGLQTQNYAPLLMKKFAAPDIAPEIMNPFSDENFTFYVGFKALFKAGITFAFRNMPEFSDVTLGGAGAYANKYPYAVVTAPLGMGKNAQGQPSMFWGYEYRGVPGYNRDVQYGEIGGVGSGFTPASSVDDYRRGGMLTEQAFHGACPNQVVLQLPV